MTVVLRHSETLELNLVEYAGDVTLAQLKALAAFAARNPAMLKRDNLNIALPGADFASVTFSALDALFARYRALYAQLEFQIYRRAAWVCLSPPVEPYLSYWLGERDLRAAFAANVRRFDNLAEAGDWLLLSPAEIAQVDSCDGFVEHARFDDLPLRAVAR